MKIRAHDGMYKVMHALLFFSFLVFILTFFQALIYTTRTITLLTPCALILSETLALYKSFTCLLTYF